MYICQFCGKECKSLNGLKHHEPYCSKNPNKKQHHIIEDTSKYSHQAWNKGLTKNTCERIKESSLLRHKKYKNGEYSINAHKWTEEEKQQLSIKRKEYLRNNPDKHVWKYNNKFKSKPCEFVKSLLQKQGISFVEELTPLTDYNYSIDIAWPDQKIGIEVNGNQHYNNDGSLKDYYQNRHNIFVKNGWTIYEIHYTKCYSLTTFNDILKLDIYDKHYVKEQFDIKMQKKSKVNAELMLKKQKKEDKYQKEYTIIKNLIENSNIDFSKSNWSTLATEYLKNRNELWNKGIFRCIRKYFPDFLKQENVWKRKGSIY